MTGRVIGPGGKPVKQGLVYGVRYSDLGLPVDFSEEERVVTRTTANGFFRLPQLTEQYLVRVCAAEPGAVECSTDPVVKSFAPSYVGPGGTTVSWLRQTSMFPPRKPSRSIGEVTVKASAVLAGTFRGGENQTVYLLRGDNTVADRAFTDEDGKYRFEVAGGTYRLEVDKDPGLRNDYTVPGFRSDKLKLKPGTIKHLSFRTRHAGVVRGTVTAAGSPVADVFLAVLDENERVRRGGRDRRRGPVHDHVAQAGQLHDPHLGRLLRPRVPDQAGHPRADRRQDRRLRARARGRPSGSRRRSRSRPSCATRPAG